MAPTASRSTLSKQRNCPSDSSFDYLSFGDIERQYPSCVTAGTLAVWASSQRYDFHLIVTKVGRKSRVRRDRWEQFLDSRTLGAEAAECSCATVGCQGSAGLQSLGCILSGIADAEKEST